MISYELAKELKKAGFVFDECNLHDCTYVGASLDAENGKNYHYPTLEELIEMCKEDFYLLQMDTDGEWWAASRSGDAFNSYGLTPADAVARLWIALNKPQNAPQ